MRGIDSADGPIEFESISGELSGEQPFLRLNCSITLRCQKPCASSFVAVDIRDDTSAQFMQAIPRVEPFIKGIPGIHRLRLDIDLPPLIPGSYVADFWLGSHYTNTFDHVRQGLVFEIADSPSQGRSFPHSKDCGNIVPLSRCEYLTSSTCEIAHP